MGYPLPMISVQSGVAAFGIAAHGFNHIRTRERQTSPRFATKRNLRITATDTRLLGPE
jgi:hypothetical protein